MSRQINVQMLNLIRAVQANRDFLELEERLIVGARVRMMRFPVEAQVKAWFKAIPDLVMGSAGLEQTHDELQRILAFQVTPEMVSAKNDFELLQFQFPDGGENPSRAWINDLIAQIEIEPNLHNQIRTLVALVGAFEEAAPDYQGLTGQDLIARSEHRNTDLQIARLHDGLTAIALTMNEDQRNKVDDSVAMAVIDGGPGWSSPRP